MSHHDRNRILPPEIVEHVWLPEDLPANGDTAIYDASGRPDEAGNVVVTTLGVSFIWARFSRRVRAGQVATMVVGNIPGAYVMDGAASEWDMSTNQPTIGTSVISLLSVERGVGVGRIVCRNTGDSDLWLAAGIGVPIFRFPPG